MATLKIRTTNHNGYVGIPLCPTSFFSTNTINLNIDWGDGSSQTITSSNDPSIELNSSTQAITVKHSYVDKGGSALISISGGFGAPGQEKLAFAQASKQNLEGVAEDFDGRGPKSTPEKMSKIYGFTDFYIHGQGDFKDFSNLILLNKDMKILLSSDPANTIQLNSIGGTYLMNQTFENVGSLDSYLVKNSLGTLIVNNNCTSLQKTFKNSSFSGDIGNWDVSSVTDASGMFEGSQAFQRKTNGWNWAALKNASSMFKNSTYKQYINPWFSGAAKSLEDTSNMFEGVSFSGNPIDRLDWNMSTVKSAKEMFKNSDFSGASYVANWFAGSNVLEDASGMFEGSDFNAPISKWNMAGVTNLSNMFKNTTSFNQNIGIWNVSSVTDASGMFEGSQAFQRKATALNWAALKNASSMFKNSTYKQYINPWFSGAAKSLEDTSNMFEGVSFSGNPIDRLDWNMSTVKSTKEMFKNTDFSGASYVANWFAGSNVLEDASGMFEGSDFNAPIAKWNMAGVTNLSNMFKNTTSFNKGIGIWNVSSVTDASGMFEGSQAFQQKVTALDWAALKNASSMFKNSTYKQYINSWFSGGAKSLEDTSNMFEGVSFSGNPIDRLDWNMSTVKSTKEMFKNTDFSGASYVANWFAGSNVLEDASGMFEESDFNAPISKWNMAGVTNLSNMFKNTTSFNQNIGPWNVSSVTDASGMFEGSQAFQGKINGWNWAALKNASSMFKNSTYKQYIDPWFSGGAKSLEDASNMFEGVSFSGNPIDRIAWDMSTVKSAKEMFKNSDFSGGNYVNNWFVSPNVLEDTSGMFEGCTKFNRPIGSWDVSSVTDASRMFKNSIFNQGISSWQLTSAENLDEMFLDNTKFNRNINPWFEYFPKVKYKNNFEGSNASFKSPSFNKFKQIMTADVSSDGLEVSMNVDISDNLDCWAYRLNAYKKYVIKTGSNAVLKLDEGTYTVRIHAFTTKLKGEALKAKLLDGTFVKGYDLEGNPKEALTEEDLTENIIGSKLYNLIQKQ